MADITIIIPAYNAANTIERCLQPLLASPNHVEVICVNDGSRDNTQKIIEDICQRDKRVRLVNQENQGPSAARNAALALVSTEYIMFCDSDDAFSADTIDYIWQDIQQLKRPDLIVFKRSNIYADGHKVSSAERHVCTELSCDWATYVNQHMTYSGHSVSVINKVYKTDIIRRENIHFPVEMELSEDLFFNLQYIPHCASFVEEYRAEYLRFLQENSLTRKPRENYFETETRAILAFAKKWPERARMISVFYNHTLCNGATQAMVRYAHKVDGKSTSERIRKIKELMNMQIFQETCKNIQWNKEPKSFRRVVRTAQSGNALAFYFVYGVFFRIKTIIRKIIPR